MPRVTAIALGALVLLGCEKDQRVASTAATTATSERPAKPEPAPEPKPVDGLFGRWTGPTTCLELYPTGEFQISLTTRGPKVVLLGEVSQRRLDGGAIELALTTTRIERSRWIGKCRKRVEREKLLDSHDVLGTAITTAAPATLTLTTKPNDEVELCGAQCETLAKATPHLAGNWRAAGLKMPLTESATWKPGELLELVVSEDQVSLWVGGDGDEVYTVYAPATTTALAPGRFRIELTATSLTGHSDPEAIPDEIELLGAALRKDTARTLTATRIPGGVEVCGEARRCARLPRFSMIR